MIEYEDKKARRVRYAKKKKKRGSKDLKLFELLGEQVDSDNVQLSRETAM